MTKPRKNKRNQKNGFDPKLMTPQQKTLNRKIIQRYNLLAEQEAVSMGFLPITGSECLWGVLVDFKAGRSDKESFKWFKQMVNKCQCDPEHLGKLYESIHSKLAMYDQLMDTECKRLGI
ncbi:MAG: hypothetical protein HWQ23_15240 [Nostoc sp. JL33]|uniref:hypothetical protein n=1 Tax=Nostoc sp. JL33 TaxID=2815396 RepID=UPI0025CE0340|nr:hypothetical protein [Nostoc sp. JL33]MBN3871578.1 hypothetical protein [Nostoc sp. JL33]